ncbi:TIR domain-containing protein [Flexithrix dorotheae]|uniref:TIR domain-containing protein n=1 Tax=Flexithrix dorotheae TaxID=70993 RepID=UPI00037C77CA|nr:TIR domain-containing protein [Flexithrix dorotheae]
MMLTTDTSLNVSDVFISYSRKNLAFATKLYNQLTEEGLEVWFDQEDIPAAVDFQNEIEVGINRAHNFVFIISPDSVISPYCRLEIEHAVKQQKRIIPILLIEPEGKLFDSINPVIKKLNWIVFREDESIFEEKFSELINKINSEKVYVHTHTKILIQALNWEAHQKRPEFLIIDEERLVAEEWLRKIYKTEQPPCIPTDLQYEFICECEKQAKHGMTEVFISYSPDQKAIADIIGKILMRNSFTIWINRAEVNIDDDFLLEIINNGIEEADNFIFLVSEKSLGFERCQNELQYALELNKRAIPIITGEVDLNNLPSKIRSLDYINLSSINYETQQELFLKEIDKLLLTLYQDAHYYEEHKEYLVRALYWKKQQENSSILLSGHHLSKARAWFGEGLKRKDHQPTSLHQQYIEASEKNAVSAEIEVFISYSNKNFDFVSKLNRDIQFSGKSTWLDQDYIPKGADIKEEIFKGIEAADNYLFIISPSSIASPYCQEEVAYAASLNKRFIVIKYKAVDPKSLPQRIAEVNWIDFEAGKSNYAESFSHLIRVLDTDKEHLHQYNKWARRALEWERNNHNSEFLLRDNEFTIASAWLIQAEEENKNPSPSDLQKKYIHKSEEEINLKQRQYKKRIRFQRIVILFLILSLGVAGYFGYILEIAKEESEKSAQEAFKLREEAIEKQEALEKQKKRLDSLQVLNEQLIAEFRKPQSSRNQQLIRELLNITDSISIKIAADESENLARQINEQKANEKKYEFHEGFAIFQKDNKYGFLNEDQKVVIPATFDDVGIFSGGLARVKQKGLWGFINTEGQIAIPFQFDLARDFKKDTASVRKFNTSYQINPDNQCLSNCGLLQQNEKLAMIRKEYEDIGTGFFEGFLRVKKGGKWGYINEEKEVIIPFEFDATEKFNNGLAKVVKNDKKQIINYDGICLENCLAQIQNLQRIEGNENISGFLIGKYEITNKEFVKFLNERQFEPEAIENFIDLEPSGRKKQRQQFIYWEDGMFRIKAGGASKPACFVSWVGAEEYCKWAGGRLPSTTEWIFAAKGGNLSKNYVFGGTDKLNEIVWLQGKEQSLTAVNNPNFPANEIGLYHISGNVWEWCASNDVNKAILKGGSFGSGPNQFKPDYEKLESKYSMTEYFGFRIVRDFKN